jgi:hypothetical protein
MRQFQGSLAPLQDLGAERSHPAQKSNFSAQAGSHSKRRATDHTAEHWDVVGLFSRWLFALTAGWIFVGLVTWGVIELASWAAQTIVAALS